MRVALVGVAVAGLLLAVVATGLAWNARQDAADAREEIAELEARLADATAVAQRVKLLEEAAAASEKDIARLLECVPEVAGSGIAAENYLASLGVNSDGFLFEELGGWSSTRFSRACESVIYGAPRD